MPSVHLPEAGICPSCGSPRALKILWGDRVWDEELYAQPQYTDTTFGGCCVADVDWECARCRFRWLTEDRTRGDASETGGIDRDHLPR